MDANSRLEERLAEIQKRTIARDNNDFESLTGIKPINPVNKPKLNLENDEIAPASTEIDPISELDESVSDLEEYLNSTNNMDENFYDEDHEDDENIAEQQMPIYTEEEYNDIVSSINEQNLSKKLSAKERAQLANEKYNSITVTPPEEKEETEDNDAVSSLLAGVKEMERQSEILSKELYAAQEEIQRSKMADLEEVGKETYRESDINDIIIAMGEQADETEMPKEQTAEELLAEYEELKKYTDMESNTDEITGPADYIIERDEQYADNIEEILRSNNITIVTKKNNSERDAVLNRFVNSGDKVTVPLVNSGIYVTMSGAGTSEIISMNSMENSESEAYQELDRLVHVCKHIVGSSIGPMKIAQLIKVVSYWDLETLYYALFAATHPDQSELSRACTQCGREYFMNVHTKDILLNPEDYEKRTTDIRDNVTTYARLLETSELGKVYKKAHSSGMIIYYKHPSIESYLTTMRNLTPETMSRYSGIADMAYGIDKIAIRDTGNSFIEITDPNKIVELISTLKSATEKYEIFDMFETIRPAATPMYGFRKAKCPHCGSINDSSRFSVANILFTQAQQEEYEAYLRWAAKEKMKRSKKN